MARFLEKKIVLFSYEEGDKWHDWPYKEWQPTEEMLLDNIVHKCGCLSYKDERGNPQVKLTIRNTEILLHAVRFSDGSIWDCINGFRDRDRDNRPCIYADMHCANYRPKTIYEK
jgi:hypothetical protein